MISVILPAYNAEAYIARAIESVMMQTYGDWELIVINDGSTDDTFRIASDYARRDSRIKLLSIPNAGVANARNEGLEMASGEMITFIDADDVMSKFFIGRCAVIMDEENADIVCVKHVNFRDDAELEKIITQRRYLEEKGVRVLSGEVGAEKSLYQTDTDGSLWGKMYRREVFEGVRFIPGEIYEDLNVMYRLMLASKRVALVDADLYYYCFKRGDSEINSLKESRLDVLKVTKRICDSTRENPELYKAACDRRFAACMNIMGLLLASPGMVKDSSRRAVIERECWEYVKKMRKATLMNKNARLKNRLGALLTILLPHPLLNIILAKVYSN